MHLTQHAFLNKARYTTNRYHYQGPLGEWVLITLMGFGKPVTDGPTERPTDGWTDTPSYRDASGIEK